MSSNDKTGERLAASVRKTKEGTGRETASGSGRSRSAASKPRQRSTTSRSAGGRSKADAAPAERDAYQHGRRIWPD